MKARGSVAKEKSAVGHEIAVPEVLVRKRLCADWPAAASHRPDSSAVEALIPRRLIGASWRASHAPNTHA